MGQEWKQATFHRNFHRGQPAGHQRHHRALQQLPLQREAGASYTAQDHSAYSATSATDCAACHGWPGTDTTTPNWLGAAGAHAATGSDGFQHA